MFSLYAIEFFLMFHYGGLIFDLIGRFLPDAVRAYSVYGPPFDVESFRFYVALAMEQPRQIAKIINSLLKEHVSRMLVIIAYIFM